MPRAPKKTAEFFPHFASDTRINAIIINKHGNEGYAIRYRLLELLCLTPDHCYDTTEYGSWDYLISFLNTNEKTMIEVFTTLADLHYLDPEFLIRGMIWCQDLVDNLNELYKKRNHGPPTKEQFLEDDSDAEIHHREDSIEIDDKKEDHTKMNNIQRIGKDNKNYKSREEKTEMMREKFPNLYDICTSV